MYTWTIYRERHVLWLKMLQIEGDSRNDIEKFVVRIYFALGRQRQNDAIPADAYDAGICFAFTFIAIPADAYVLNGYVLNGYA